MVVFRIVEATHTSRIRVSEVMLKEGVMGHVHPSDSRKFAEWLLEDRKPGEFAQISPSIVVIAVNYVF